MIHTGTNEESGISVDFRSLFYAIPGAADRIWGRFGENGYRNASLVVETWLIMQNDANNIADQRTLVSKFFDPPVPEKNIFHLRFWAIFDKKSTNLVSLQSSMNVGKRAISQYDRNAILMQWIEKIFNFFSII